MKSVYVTREIPRAGITMLEEKGYEVDVSTKDGVLTRHELIEALSAKPYDAVLCLLTDKIDGEVFDAAPQGKIFANYAVGYDNINLDDAKARDVVISNTPGVLSIAVAEHTFALMMSIAHRIPEADRFTRAGHYDGWAPMLFLGTRLSGKTLGVLGAGRIGSRVAHHGKHSFEMNIIYYDIKRNEQIEADTGASYRESVEEVLQEADFVTVHVPLLESTRHLIDAKRLSMMKPTAHLINTSRGPVIDEEALVKALKDGTIRGAAIDVFENEPELADGLAELDNVILTPHIASATENARTKMSELAAGNIIAVIEGEEAPNRVV